MEACTLEGFKSKQNDTTETLVGFLCVRCRGAVKAFTLNLWKYVSSNQSQRKREMKQDYTVCREKGYRIKRLK